MGQISNQIEIKLICKIGHNIMKSIISRRKSNLRNTYKQKRKEMSLQDVKIKSISAANTFLSSDIYKNAKQIMLYMPLGNETDTSLIMSQAFADGKKVILPVTDKISGIITPVCVTSATEFKQGAFLVSEPQISDAADATQIDVIVVPGIAFGKSGERIGFGKGCYDMFLKNAKGIKVGYCYEWQVCDKILSDSHDVKMDYIITESRKTSTKKY